MGQTNTHIHTQKKPLVFRTDGFELFLDDDDNNGNDDDDVLSLSISEQSLWPHRLQFWKGFQMLEEGISSRILGLARHVQLYNVYMLQSPLKKRSWTVLCAQNVDWQKDPSILLLSARGKSLPAWE